MLNIKLKTEVPSATSSTINLTWIRLGLNPGLLGDRPANSHLNHATVLKG